MKSRQTLCGYSPVFKSKVCHFLVEKLWSFDADLLGSWETFTECDEQYNVVPALSEPSVMRNHCGYSLEQDIKGNDNS